MTVSRSERHPPLYQGKPMAFPGRAPQAHSAGHGLNPGKSKGPQGESIDSPLEGKAKDPVDDLGESFGLLSIGRAQSDSISSGAHKNQENRRQNYKQRGGKNPKSSAADTTYLLPVAWK